MSSEKKHYTLSDIETTNLHLPKRRSKSYKEKLGDPGQYPFTRGPHPRMYQDRLWTMRMFAGFGTAEETNERFKMLREKGQTGLSTAFDLPTLYGYDTDHPLAIGDFGRGGVACSSLADMEILFQDIPLDEISTSMTISGPAFAIWAMFLANAEKQGIDKKILRGTLQNDILKEFSAQLEFIYPINPSLRLVTDTIEYAMEETPKFNPISISGYHIRERGSTAVQELAFTLKDGFTYVEECLKRGLDIDEFAPRLSFFFNFHNDFFEEICKIRAARRIWAKELKEKYGAKNERSLWLRTHVQTAGCSLWPNRIENNIIRVTTQTLGAVLAGAQSIHTDSKDEALTLPSEEAVQTALATQQIIAYESGIPNSVDPLCGSIYVENLTDKLEAAARVYFRKIDDMGGMVAALEAGYPQNEIINSAIEYERKKDAGELLYVGVNIFKEPETDTIKFKIDPKGREKHLERLNKVRSTRDPKKVTEALENIREACIKGQNIMPVTIDAVKSYVTLGEIREVTTEVFGEAPRPD